MKKPMMKDMKGMKDTKESKAMMKSEGMSEGKDDKKKGFIPFKKKKR